MLQLPRPSPPPAAGAPCCALPADTPHAPDAGGMPSNHLLHTRTYAAMLQAHPAVPDGKIKLVRGGSCAVMASIHASSCPVCVVGKAVRCSLLALELSRGVAMADPTSSSLDCVCCNCTGTHDDVFQRGMMMLCDPYNTPHTCASRVVLLQCSLAMPSTELSSSTSPSAAKTSSSLARRWPLYRLDVPLSPVRV